MLRLDGHTDGAISDDGQVMGGYRHGLFDGADSCAAILPWAGLKEGEAVDYDQHRQRDLDRLWDMVDQYMEMTVLLKHLT